MAIDFRMEENARGIRALRLTSLPLVGASIGNDCFLDMDKISTVPTSKEKMDPFFPILYHPRSLGISYHRAPFLIPKGHWDFLSSSTTFSYS